MIYLGADKHGLEVVGMIETYLKENKIPYQNLGVKTIKENILLEDLIPKVATKILGLENNKGILICGTGIGITIGANKIKGIRANLATDKTIAEWSVVYDNCNVLCLSGWNPDKKMLKKS